jgi:WD40 repeat protein
MDVETAIQLVEEILGESGLKDLQEQIFRQVWDGQKYPDIADTLGYDPIYIKDLGAKLWKQLSLALKEKVNKSNYQSVLRRYAQRTNASQSISLPLNAPPPVRVAYPPMEMEIDVDTAGFVGREAELTTLVQWVQAEHCRLIALLGMGGLGKTTLAAQFARTHQDQFDQVIWRSLKHAPSLETLLNDLLNHIYRYGGANLPPPSDSPAVTDLSAYLTQVRCLIILDNLETLLQPGSLTCDYREDYEAYGELFQHLGSVRHQSCLLMTCREKPQEWLLLEESNAPVHSLTLPPLSTPAATQLLQPKGKLRGTPEDWQRLNEQYSGNPLVLQIVATTILELFEGDLAAFLAEGQFLFDGLAAFLKQQWNRLSPAEQVVLGYLAMRREDCSLPEIKADLRDPLIQRHLVETMTALNRRSLVEKRNWDGRITFHLQPVVQEYVTQRWIDWAVDELQTQRLRFLHICPLRKLRSRDFIQVAQCQTLLRPILEQLAFQLPSNTNTSEHLRQVLAQLQAVQPPLASYAAGTIVNLLIEAGIALTDLDLSNLPLWEVNFTAVSLQDVNLARADLSRTLFANAFGGVMSVALSPKGDRFASGHEEGGVLVWDREGRQLQQLNGHEGWIWGLTWTPDGKWLLSASEDQQLRVWDPATGTCQQSLIGHGDRVWRVVCPTSTVAISASSDHTLKVWDLTTGTCVRTLVGHAGDVTALALTAVSTEILSGGADQTMIRWDWQQGQILDQWTSQQGWVWAVAESPSTQSSLSAGDRGQIEAWQRGQSEPSWQLQHRAERIWSLAVVGDRYLLAGGDSFQLDLWDLEQRTLAQSIGGYSGRLWCIQTDALARWVITASEDATIRLWDLPTLQPLISLHSQSNWACEVAIPATASSPVVGAFSDGNIYLWSQNGSLQTILRGHSQPVWSLAVSPLGDRLISGSEDKTLRLWELETGQCLAQFKGHTSRIWGVAWTPDGNEVISASGDRTLRIWSIDNREARATLTGHASRVWTVAVSPDGETVASGGGDRTVKLWQRTTGECLGTLTGHHSRILSVAFHPSQPILASVGGDGCCRLWDLQTQTQQVMIPVPTRMIWSVAWSPDGRFLAMGGDDHQVRVWDTQNQDWQAMLTGHGGCVWSVAFAATGREIVSGSQDGTIRLWDLATHASQRLFRPKRLYEGLNLNECQGLTSLQVETLKQLGAIEGN